MNLSSINDWEGRGRGKATPASTFLLLDAALSLWVWFAFWSFEGQAQSGWIAKSFLVACVPVVARLVGLDRTRKDCQVETLLRAGLHVTGLWALYSLSAGLFQSHLEPMEALWVSCATGLLCFAGRAVLEGSRDTSSDTTHEVMRWVLLGTAATLMPLCFYSKLSLGSGDAHWYAIMLADFVTQMRHGVFPVWVGQSIYAFNGAVSPLRFAPGFQYLGGFLDLLTGQSLDLIALRNAEIAIISLVAAFSAYACLRPILAGRSWLAFFLSIFWITGPAVVAPLMTGDQYMTFAAVPFIPVVLHGCWRVWEFDDRWGRLWIAVGLAGTWICHSPVGMWMTCISGILYLASILRGRRWKWEAESIGFMAAVFLVLGAWPFVSVLTLENQYEFLASAGYAVQMIWRYFPENFLPIDLHREGLTTYQVGYSLLAVLLAALWLAPRSRAKAAWPFVVAAFVVPVFTIPVPWITKGIWMHAPQWFVTINNVWPMQRVFLVWSALIVFAAAIILSPVLKNARATSYRLTLAFLALGALWSAREARKLEHGLSLSSTPGETALHFSPDNLQLTRYAYSSFELTPAYFSHAYAEPWLENRLLDLQSLEPFLSNSDAAAPPPDSAPSPSQGGRLVQAGFLDGERVGKGNFYRLAPTLKLAPRQHYALRLEFLQPEQHGTLQFFGHGLFREYSLPDSGAGVARLGPTLAFGSETTSSHVVPLILEGAGGPPPEAFFIAERFTTEKIPFARFWLYAYDRTNLPIVVSSWIPYQAHVVSPRPAFLETPRMWLKGWSVMVNGQLVRPERSLQNLLMVPIDSGRSEVTIEYHPSLAVASAFWASALGWLVLLLASVCQLVLGGRGQRIWQGVLSAVYPIPYRTVFGGRGPAALRSFVWKRRAWGLAALAIVAGATLFFRLRAKADEPRRSSGPIMIQFTRHADQRNYSEPLFATGKPGKGVVVFLQNLERGQVRVGADIWGRVFYSAAISMPYNRTQSLVVSDSALYPLEDPDVKALKPAERDALRENFRLELNGKVLIDEKAYAFESDVSQILIGASHFGSLASGAFTGRIINVERLSIPRILILPWGWHAEIRLRFPVEKIGATEPLASLRSGSAVRVCSVTYLSQEKAMISIGGVAGAPAQSAEVHFDPSSEHVIELAPGQVPGDPSGMEVGCFFDGTRVIGRSLRPTAAPTEIWSGINCAEIPGAGTRFTGPLIDLKAIAIATQPAAPENFGAEHILLKFPDKKTGRREPVLTTGTTGSGDFIYVIYQDEHHIRFGHDHWGGAGVLSEPITIDYSRPHEVWIRSGALYPPARDDSFWKTLSPIERLKRLTGVDVIFDGETVLSSPIAPYPTSPSETQVGKNAIGGSTCDPEFSGAVEFAERAGTLLPTDR